MFFRADDARSQTSLPATRPTLKKEPSFFYANGQKEDQSSRSASKSPPPPTSPPLPALGTKRSQFFHADGTSDIAFYQQSPPLASPPLSIDAHTMVHPSASAPVLRPSSPSKDSIHLSYRKGASQVIRPNSILPPREGKETSTTPRRASVEMNSSLFGHAKTTSLSSITSGSIDSGSRRSSLAPGVTSQPGQTPLSINTATRKVSPPSIASPHAVSVDAQVQSSTPVSTPLSPSKAVSNAASQLTELAANARRERKVMDLEISNNSLLAINRQLEKQLRSQKAELRRYRRLTRAGRLSMAPSDLDEMFNSEDEAYLDSEDEDGQNDSSFLSDDNSDDSDESAMSPSALAEYDSRKIAKDEKRLRLDLSKHRQLLVDSQKMNQSLRRCLGWTEELINEGKKALSYNVRVSDVKLGGRVLRRDEEFEESFEENFEEQNAPIEEEEETEGHEDHEDQQDDVGDVLGLMSPWMRLGSSRNSREDTPSPGGESGGFFGLGIQTAAGANSILEGQPGAAS